MPKPYPMGVEVTKAGKCPMGHTLPMACMWCSYGHLTECHYPMECMEALCSHCLVAEEEKPFPWVDRGELY